MLEIAAIVAATLAPSGPVNHPPYPILKVRKGARVRLYDKPRGKLIGIIGDETMYGRRTILSVTRRRGGWAAVTTWLVPNGDRAWVYVDPARLARRTTRWSLHADLTDRELVVRHDGEEVRRFRVTIGLSATRTPRGQMAVTDKLAGRGFGSEYGCCIVALSGRQPKVRTNGIDGRMAIHGTVRPDLIGRRGSQGCLRAEDRRVRWLMRKVPVGAPVFIRE